MTRVTKVYTLNQGIDERTAVEQLLRTQKELPEGAVLHIYRRSDEAMELAIPWLPFGDLVQIIDFVKTGETNAFEDSEAYASQNRRTKGFFSNIATISCPIVE